MPSRERTIRTEAIVLRHKNVGEADRILTLFTPEAGKIRVMAKGIRKPRSRKAGHLDLYTRSNIMLARGRDMDLITQAETVEAYRPMREDLLRSTYGSYCVELLDKFTPDEAENKPMYHLLAEALGWLSATNDLALTTRYYELQIIGMAGYQIELFRCVVNGEVIQAEDQFFSPMDGGVVCPVCGQTRQGVFPISLNALKVLRFMIRSHYDTLRDLKLGPEVQTELERIIHRTITYYLEQQLKSVEFLKLVRQAVA